MDNLISNNLYLFEPDAFCGSIVYYEGEYHIFYIANNQTCIRHYQGENLLNLKKKDDIISKYKKEKKAQTVLIPFHADRQLDYDKQVFFRGGYLFLQSVYYQLQMNTICRKLKQKYKRKECFNHSCDENTWT